MTVSFGKKIQELQLTMLSSAFNEQQVKTKRAVMEVEATATQIAFSAQLQKLLFEEQKDKTEKAELDLKVSRLMLRHAETQIEKNKLPSMN